jgi:hypothetical protein
MRVGLTTSVLGHAIILGLGLVAFTTRPLEAEKIEALPVELISVDETTDLLKGDEDSRVLPEEKPQPKPDVVAEIPAPEPEEKPAEKVVEATAPPPPPPPPPEPEPEVIEPPEPETEVAALPEPAPEPEAIPEPLVVVPADPNVPRPRPEPPKPVVKQPAPKPEPPPAVAEPPPPEQEFNPDDIAALLNKDTPQGGGDPEPAEEPQTIGSIDGHAEAAMTQDEIAALKARLYQCWNPPVGVREAGGLIVEVRISLLPDGSLAKLPEVRRVEQAGNPLAQVAAEAALRAVVQCAPFGDILRPEKYAVWQLIEFVFDPREMLGG